MKMQTILHFLLESSKKTFSARGHSQVGRGRHTSFQHPTTLVAPGGPVTRSPALVSL